MDLGEVKDDTLDLNNILHYGIHLAAFTLKISERSLRRECARKHIQYMRHMRGLYFLPVWLDDWLMKRTVQPRKTTTMR